MTTRTLTCNCASHPKYAGLWSSSVGHVNVATYAPGTSVQAFPGCPVFKNLWVNVYWYPGVVERITVHLDEHAAVSEYKGGTTTVELCKTHDR